MTDTRRMVQIYSSSALVAALSQVQSGWVDIGRKCSRIEVIRSVYSGGTYVFEVDWSNDGGASTLATDTVSVVATGTPAYAVPKGRWARVRVKNTHATIAFASHTTSVNMDSAAGR